MHAPLKSTGQPCWPALQRAALPALLLAALLVFFHHVQPFRAADPAEDAFLFEVEIAASQAGTARLYYDRGDGFRLPDSTANRVAAGEQTLRFAVPPESYLAFRLHPLEGSGEALIRPLRIVTVEGRVMREFTLGEWQPSNQLAPLDRGFALPGGRDSALVWRTQRALVLQPPLEWPAALLELAGLAVAFAVLLARTEAWSRPRAEVLLAHAARWRSAARAHPHVTLFAAALVAVLVSCHPVVFFGRSFVSPNNRALCLYDDFPTIPGGPAAPIDNPKGSDMGAMMWAHLPYSVVQHRSIFEDHEIPLWNRFNEAGVTLLGQGQSMIGDPLHWITIFANGATWAWDLKFVLAKLLFAFGIGLLVHQVTQRLGVSALLAASSAFIGFFAYRFNHAAFFSVCYAPWILVAWLGIARGRGLPAAILLTVALGMESQSGTAKESAMLMAGLSLAGALDIVLRREAAALRIRKLALGVGAGVVFLLASAPAWLTFVDALRKAFTVYDVPRAFQIQPSQFIGLFEDLFYRQQVPGELQANPSANFLLLLGVLWAAVYWRTLGANRTFVACALAALPPLLAAFAILPPAVIESIPFIGKISHVDNTFSCVVIVLLFPLAGCGLQACRDRFATREWRGDWLLTLALLAALVALYFGNVHAVSRAEAPYYEPRPVLLVSEFFRGYAPLLLACVAGLPLAVRSLLHTRRQQFAAGLVVVFSLGVLHFRHGMYLATRYDTHVMNPQRRVELAARSPALDFVAARTAVEPGRVAGLGGILVPGFNVLHGLEHFSGPDAILNRQYRELLVAAGLPVVNDWRHYVYPESYPALRHFYDLCGVRWLLGKPEDRNHAVPGLELRAAHDLEVFESPTAWPRAFFTDRVSTYGTAADFAALVAASDGRPFAAIQPGSPGTPSDWTLPTDQASRRIVEPLNYRLTANRTGFAIETPGPGLVVLQEAWLDGDFHVTVDGVVTPYGRVNHAFRGVWVGNSGRHWIDFSYRPRVLKPAVWLAGLGLILLCSALAVSVRRGLVE